MRITFLNNNREENLESRGLRELNSRAEDIRAYMEGREEQKDLPPFNEYGLCFDYVEIGTFQDQQEDYYRFQFCWGGPSSELRIYEDRMEFVFLDWFCGIGFDVSNEDWAQFIKNDFQDIDILNFQRDRENSDYYERVLDLEDF